MGQAALMDESIKAASRTPSGGWPAKWRGSLQSWWQESDGPGRNPQASPQHIAAVNPPLAKCWGIGCSASLTTGPDAGHHCHGSSYGYRLRPAKPCRLHAFGRKRSSGADGFADPESKNPRPVAAERGCLFKFCRRPIHGQQRNTSEVFPCAGRLSQPQLCAGQAPFAIRRNPQVWSPAAHP